MLDMRDNDRQHEILSDRAKALLKALVARYIREGTPVGSKTLAVDVGSSLSPATIRNVLADLEAQGFLESPHTSAGRVPTAQAYRFFVENLITTEPIRLQQAELQQAKNVIQKGQAASILVESAANLVSQLTNLASLITIPKRDHLLLRHIEFISLGDNRVLVVLVINDGEVQNRIIHTNKIYEKSELQQAANYLTECFSGSALTEISEQVRNAMYRARSDINDLMQTALAVADQVLTTAAQANGYVLTGQDTLLDVVDAANLERLRELFTMFNQKQQLLHLVDQSLSAEGFQIFIGADAGYEVFEDYALLSKPYSVNRNVVGVVGVIGPARMHYDRAISAIDITAKLLSAALSIDDQNT